MSTFRAEVECCIEDGELTLRCVLPPKDDGCELARRFLDVLQRWSAEHNFVIEDGEGLARSLSSRKQ